MSSLPRVPSSSLRAQAYESFQQQIVAANIRPGQFISQRELMQLLGMPLGAVRELIPRLEAEGLLRTVPQRGLQIAPCGRQAGEQRFSAASAART